MTPYIDIHTHRDPEEIPDGVVSMRSISLNDKTLSGMDYLAALPSCRLSAGIHPWDAPTLSDADVNRAIQYLQTADLSAIGEIGLDFYRNNDPIRQIQLFRQQLEIAMHRQLPVVLHCVKSLDQTIAILSRYRLPAVVFHGFTNSPQAAARLAAKGYCLSFGESMMHSPKTCDALLSVNPDRIFFETDDSQCPIEEIYQYACGLLGTNLETLKTRILANYQKVFV